jgi:hypothetical protein
VIKNKINPSDMNSANKFLKFSGYFLSAAYIVIALAGCSREPLVGKIFYYYDDSSKLIAGFEKDTLYYVLRQKSPVSPQEIAVAHKSKYTMTKTSDSSVMITLEKKPTFWEKNTWEIVLRDPNTIYSVESGKIYRKTEDKSLLKK